VFAGTGAGKTLCGLAEDIRWCRENTGIVGYVFEPTYPMVKRILLPTLERDLLLGCPVESNEFVSKFNRADMCLEFKNGSRLWFGSLDDPEKSEGVNIDFAHLDEPRLMRHFDVCWNVIRRRLRGSNQNIPYPRGAWVTTTPDTPGSCLFNFFENPLTKNPLGKIYRWSIFENPNLPRQFLEEMKRTHSGGYAERFLYGRFAEIAQGSFPFDSTVHTFTILKRID
jgi:hypothetical protein